jgi:hypothetical protein
VSLQYFVLAGSLFGSPWADANTTPRLLLGLVILGAVAGVVQYRLRGVLWLGATLVALPLNTPAVAGPGISGYSVRPSMPVVVSQYANARYHLPSMYLACGLVGLGGAALMEALRRFRGRPIPAAGLVTAGIICAAAAPRFDLLQRMWAPQREFEVFRDGLHRIDPSCRVVTLLNTIDAGMIPFRYLAPERLSDLSEFVAAPTLDHCVIYYRCANCYAQDLVPWKDWATFDVNPACREIEERFQLDPIIETKIAALPFRAETYSRDPLPLGFYRVRERAADSGAVKRTGESAPGAATR